MNTRRDALKMMAAGLGSCVLPSIGFSQTRLRPAQGANIMGVDQCDWSFHYIVKTSTVVIQGYCDFEDLPGLMDKYKIDRCVIQQDPSCQQAVLFARQFPGRVTPCCWINQRLRNSLYYVPGIPDKLPSTFFLNWDAFGSYKTIYTVNASGSYQTIYTVKKVWDHPRENRRDDTILYARIAEFIQMAT